MSQSKANVVRVVTLGDSGAGKSSLLTRYTANTFYANYAPTIGIDFRLKSITYEGRRVRVQVWDTAGQERYRNVTANYYRGAHGIALVYDVTMESSFGHIRRWIDDVRTYAGSSVKMVLIGNKTDLEHQRVVSTEQGRELAEHYKVPFYETSAKSGEQVDQAFDGLVDMICVSLYSKKKGGGDGKQSGGSERKVDLHGSSSSASGTTKKNGCC